MRFIIGKGKVRRVLPRLCLQCAGGEVFFGPDACLVRMFGPWWVITLCGPSGSPHVSLSVSALAGELRIQDGRLIYSPIHGEEFHPLGVPLRERGGLPLPPEEAVRIAATRLGVQVAAAPRIVLRPQRYPQRAAWRLELARPVSARVQGREMEVQTVFVSADREDGGPRLYVASDSQPPELTISWPVLTKPLRRGDAVPRANGTVRRRPDFPTELLPVR